MKKTYCFAGISVEADFHYPYLEEQCRDYETKDTPLFSICVSEENIEWERKQSDDGAAYPVGYLESLAFYRLLATGLLPYGILLFHGSAVSFDRKGYIFTAPSGTGKSTHTRLCREEYGERFAYINDDKPLLRLKDEKWYVYGTPWDGKHHLSQNICVPLCGICFLHRGEKNEIFRIDAKAGVSGLYAQAYRPEAVSDMQRLMPLVIGLSSLPLWDLYCTVSREAAKISLPTMAGDISERT